MSIIRYYDQNPYLFSFVFSILITLVFLFYSPPLEIEEDTNMSENLQIVNIDTMEAPRRIVKKSISTEEGETSDEATTERARGTSDLSDAVDLSFYPNIAPPKPIGKLKKIYPKSARDMGIEATLYVEIFISPSGKVLDVTIKGTRLNKDVPPEIYGQIIADFSRAARNTLMSARFTPPVIQGKKVPVKMEMPLRYYMDVQE